MDINIVKASGEGSTALAAFDKALLKAGIANFNIIYLSSIIPKRSRIIIDKPKFDEKDFGNKLYCVVAQKRETIANKHAWSGIGWVQDKKTGRGLFVEHEGYTEDEVQQDIYKTLTDMKASRPKADWTEIDMVTEGIVCGGKPVCALVAAVYSSEGWK